MTDADRLDLLSVNTIRTLSIDAVEKAGSGHPGTPMDAAPTVYCLWQRFLRYDPEDPAWPDRDRFVLSNGHASAMLYSLLFLAGVRSPHSTDFRGDFAVSLDDLMHFRQPNSRCPGHPEYGWTVGVEATTGPLGQGVAASVGMAIAQRWLAATYNRPGYDLFTHNVYALCGDGCLMEGISSEAASLAGHLRLSNLCWIYDDNHVTIEGPTSITFTEDVGARFLSYGWNIVRVSDPNDLGRLGAAYETFLATDARPTLIIIQSHIGYGAPHKQDTAAAHGEPLGSSEVRLAKEFYGWDPDLEFYVPEEVQDHFRRQLGRRGAAARASWNELFSAYQNEFPDLAEQIDRIEGGRLPDDWHKVLPTFPPDPKGLATRDSSGKVLNAVARQVPWLLGGAADLAPSTKTHLSFEHAGEFQPSGGGDFAGRNFHFGIREHAMCAIANGMALSKLRPFASSFFVFTDYCRGALRLSSLMELAIVYVWTHDSVSLGEDGPTHQPIEHLASLRALPGMIVIRPADANEVAAAWRIALETSRPVSLVLTRQAVPTLEWTGDTAATGVPRGGYILVDAPQANPDVILIATGSEVRLSVAAREQLMMEGIQARIVSLPSWELFDSQDSGYRDHVLPPDVTARVSVEEASSFGWERYAGREGGILGIDSFGLSGPIDLVQRHFGFTPEHVVTAARDQVARRRAAGI